MDDNGIRFAEVADEKVQTIIPTPIIRGLMQAEDPVFIKKYKEITGLRIITDLVVEFTPVIAEKSKSKVTPQNAKISTNCRDSRDDIQSTKLDYILDTVWGGLRDLNP